MNAIPAAEPQATQAGAGFSFFPAGMKHTPGEGRLSGLMGALQVRNADGTVFLIGTGFSDAQRAAPPPVGSRIVYSCRGQTRHGLPRFPSFLRIGGEP